MVHHYLRVSFRKLIRQKAFTAINVIGLSISLSGALLVYLYVAHELSYDRFHEKADRIYRIYCAYASPPEQDYHEFPYTPSVLVPALKEAMPEIEAAVRMYPVSEYRTVIMKYDDVVLNETGVYMADSGFFDVFSAHFLSGDQRTALSRPNSVVLTESAATRYFGEPSSAVGKIMNVSTNDDVAYEVTAVVKDFPPNSHFHFSALLSIDYARQNFLPDNWLSHDPTSYVLLAKHADLDAAQSRIRALTEKALNPVYVKRFGKTYDEHKKNGGLQEYRLQPLERVHLYSAGMNDTTQGNILYVYLFAAVGIMLVCIATFNYINLSTAQSAREGKAAAIRKLLGVRRSQFYGLCATESVIVVLVSGIISIALVQLLLATGTRFLSGFLPFESPPLTAYVMVIGLVVVIGLISALVPTGIQSALRPANVIKGQLVHGQKGNRLRQVFVVAQFTASMILIICTLLVGRQVDYLLRLSPGFDRENLLVIRNVDKLGNRKFTLKQALRSEPSVINATLCYNALGEPHNYAAFTPVELIEQGNLTAVGIPVYLGDQDYLSTLGVPLLKGHPFPPNLARENQQIILNEEALKSFGWQDRPEEELVGKIIDVNGLRYELAGVVQNYHFNSFRQKIAPMAIMSHYYSDYESLMLRIGPGTQRQAIARMAERWWQIAPDVPFEYSFVDEDLQKLYSTEQNLGILSAVFAGMAVFVASLGLLGLAMFSAQRRVKEIGIRKVLGATVRNIVVLLSRDIVRLVLLAFVVASPVAWYLIHRWLENFAYHIDIGYAIFLLAGGLTLLIAVGTISIQTIRAALANPAEAIRNE